jgi:hypothetical protein
MPCSRRSASIEGRCPGHLVGCSRAKFYSMYLVHALLYRESMKTLETTELADVTGGEVPWYHPDANTRDESVYDYKPMSFAKCLARLWRSCPDERTRK